MEVVPCILIIYWLHFVSANTLIKCCVLDIILDFGSYEQLCNEVVDFIFFFLYLVTTWPLRIIQIIQPTEWNFTHHMSIVDKDVVYVVTHYIKRF